MAAWLGGSLSAVKTLHYRHYRHHRPPKPPWRHSRRSNDTWQELNGLDAGDHGVGGPQPGRDPVARGRLPGRHGKEAHPKAWSGQRVWARAAAARTSPASSCACESGTCSAGHWPAKTSGPGGGRPHSHTWLPSGPLVLCYSNGGSGGGSPEGRVVVGAAAVGEADLKAQVVGPQMLAVVLAGLAWAAARAAAQRSSWPRRIGPDGHRPTGGVQDQPGVNLGSGLGDAPGGPLDTKASGPGGGRP